MSRIVCSFALLLSKMLYLVPEKSSVGGECKGVVSYHQNHCFCTYLLNYKYFKQTCNVWNVATKKTFQMMCAKMTYVASEGSTAPKTSKVLFCHSSVICGRIWMRFVPLNSSEKILFVEEKQIFSISYGFWVINNQKIPKHLLWIL